jgi:sugar lactone lactonase YvrE
MRRVPLLLPPLVAFASSLCAEPSIHSITPVLEAHSVGGVTIDALGNLYVADFGEVVFKITPEGKRVEIATGLYGASGNAIDGAGNLLQSNFYASSIVRVDRRGIVSSAVTKGLAGPVGIAIEPRSDEFFVANCQSNDIVRVSAAGEVSRFAAGPLFKCPNGLAFGPDHHLFVTNFRDGSVLEVTPDGAVKLFAHVSGRGLGHLCFGSDRFYVTAYASHSVYELTLDGKSRRILGNGERGLVDGSGSAARLSFPNGIACDPYFRRLYINEYVNESTEALPRRAIVRRIDLD